MAQPIPCDNDHGVLANILVSSIDTGDVQSLCLACFPDWCRATADILDQQREATTVDDSDTEDTPDQEAGPAETPAPQPQETEPEESAADGQEPASEEVTDKVATGNA